LTLPSAATRLPPSPWPGWPSGWQPQSAQTLARPGGGRFLLAAAKPIGELIARYGPFVMNTRAEIEQTLQDLRTGHFIRNEARDG
jgi:hypothetical protein